MKYLITLITAFILSLSCDAQSFAWENITSNYQLPAGVRLFHGTVQGDDTFAYYYEVDLTIPDIGVRPYLRSTPAQVHNFTEEVGAYAAINGGFFSGTTSVSSVIYINEVLTRNITSVVRNNKTYPLIRPVFALNTDRTPSTRWVYHHSYQLDDIYVYAQPLQYVCDDPDPLPVPLKADGCQWDSIAYGIGGGPQLIKDGQVNITYCEEVFWGSGVYMTDYRPRTAVGYTQDQKIIMFVTNNMKIGEVAETLLLLGCYEAMNLDGGGSSAISAGGQSLYDQNRAVPTILAIVHADSMSIPPAIVFEKTIDTGDPGVNSQGSWFPTANPGSWGNPSMLHGLASHDQFYEFPLNLPAAGEYQIHSWWTTSSNRSTNTPFFISHAGGVAQVAVNQTIGGSMWNLIGTYTFNGTAEEKVRITAGATTNQYVVADAIRIVSYDTQLDLNRIVYIEPVSNITVPTGTSKEQALAMLSQSTNITTTHNLIYTVNLQWDSPQYSPDLPGEYQAVGTFDLPPDVWQSSPPMPLLVYATITVDNNTGLERLQHDRVRVFGDLAEKLFIIEGRVIDKSNLKIFNLEGKLLYQQEISGTFKQQLRLTHFKSGIYLLRITGNDVNFNYKIILN